jgi:hypothetical protein
MPHTLAALRAGVLSEWRATLIVRESACLTVEHRRELDERMCAHPATLDGKGDRRITADAKAIAYQLDPRAIVDRAARAHGERTVTTRPAPDSMVYLTALLPLTQGIGAYAALRRAADTTTDGRSRGQVMADTLVDRLTGRPAQAPVPVEVNLVITDDTLLGGDTTPARIPGYGPIPAAIARHLVAHTASDARSRATLRRLYRHPRSGALIAMESRARLFPTGLARFIAVRDDTCATPYCGAPIRHTDHATDHHHGGTTSAANGRGTCAACNYAKQAPGWQIRTHHQRDGTHTTHTITPTGARHRTHAPPLPGPTHQPPSLIEIAFAQRLTA